MNKSGYCPTICVILYVFWPYERENYEHEKKMQKLIFWVRKKIILEKLNIRSFINSKSRS
jgi:hypothetical protein